MPTSNPFQPAEERPGYQRELAGAKKLPNKNLKKTPMQLVQHVSNFYMIHQRDAAQK